jgi:virginiamycin B lyase
VAGALLVVLVGGLILGLILAHRADVATPTPTIAEFALPTACGATGCAPAGITRGPDGNLWFTEQGGNHIGRITPAGTIEEFALPTTCTIEHPCEPAGITSGPDGNLWFTEQAANQIGRISP